ncbi:hypothetical protein [Pseudodesulfovibrio sp.]|uniref:hypothetical protein n=1 Tax=Pseudodesulfovibrio sp. TaxID=2035812 RepID=UPI0026327582|nr:hypothetical protein [Pseudodesulfovibrio sp.]MDD3310962.1 hypothetical protein [Pseudodesulfovibrio sp.]
MYQELDTIRLKAAQEGPGNYGQGVVYAVPSGAEGTVIQVFGHGEALEVEFAIIPPELDGDVLVHPGTYHVITLTPDQVAPV